MLFQVRVTREARYAEGEKKQTDVIPRIIVQKRADNMAKDKKTAVYKGISVARGIATGPAYVIDTAHFPTMVPHYNVPGKDLNREMKRFRNACRQSRKELEDLVQRLEREVGRHEADMLRPQVMMVEDPTLVAEVEEGIIEKNQNCEAAVAEVIERFEKMMGSLEDHYLRERSADIRDAGRRILSQLLFVDGQIEVDISKPVIIVSMHLVPSLTVHLEREKVLAFATEKGGYNSHAAILARSLGIPAVTGLENISQEIVRGEILVVDGMEGIAIAGPDEEQLAEYERKARRFHHEEDEVIAHVADPTTTRDGRHLSIRANIGRARDIEKALEYRAEGVGLYRTEFNYMSRNTLPDEDILAKEYSNVACRFGDQGVVLRILDIGGDKFPPAVPLAHEENPFIGQRGLRLMLEHVEDLMLPQLRAIIRSSASGRVSVLYPMVTCVEDLEAAEELFERAATQVREEGHDVKDDIEQGIMIEVPSCIPILEELLSFSDFATIGTNDFVQYLLAADRNSARMVDAYDPYQPAVIRMLALIARKGAEENKPISICGEMGGDVSFLPVFLGLGFASLSVNVQSIPYLREAVRGLETRDCEELAARVLKARRSDEVRELIERFREAQDYDSELKAVGQ